MARVRNAQNPPCARCGATETVSKGRENGRLRWRCLACGRTLGHTERLQVDLLQSYPAISPQTDRIDVDRQIASNLCI